MKKVQVTKNGVFVCCGYQADDGRVFKEREGRVLLLNECQIKEYTVIEVAFFPGEKVEAEGSDGVVAGYLLGGRITIVETGPGSHYLCSTSALRPHTPTREYTVELTERHKQALIANADKRNNDSAAWLEAVDILTAAVQQKEASHADTR